MRCPKCGSLNTYVLDTRANIDQTKKRRRHECNACGERFSTIETYRDVYIRAKEHNTTVDKMKSLLKGETAWDS